MLMKDTKDHKYFFLSTFYISPISLEIDGKLCHFTNVEAAFQAQKCPEVAENWSQIKGLEAKRLGEELQITVNDWDHYQFYAMANALHEKFNNKLLLLDLKMIKEDIVQDNYWHDNLWGNCTCSKCRNINGKNIYGRMLQNIRDNNNDLNSLNNFIQVELINSQ